MKKALICGVALAFVCSLAFVGMSMAEEKGPAEITMGTKKPAVFPHAKHQEKLKCGECHHGKDADGKQVPFVEGQKIEKCETCHTGDMLKDSGIKGKTAMQRAGHGNCLACHKKNENKALKKCSTCHPKKKK